MTDTSQIQLFQSADGEVQLEITLEQETLWLTQLQMGALFDTTPENVLMHLKNIYSEQELTADRTTKDFLVVRQEGKRQVKRSIKHYSLDAIISVGYRVSSARATQFRIWATNVLKQHLVQGYTLNQKRLQERGIEFDQAVQLLSQTLVNQALISPEGADVISVVSDYARSWSLLQAYDELLYPNIASRAAHLLYFVIKNHPLADGNKRTGSFLFLWYLRINQQFLAKPVDDLINDNTLVALALLVAESKPDQRALIIRLVQQFIVLKAV